MDHLKYTRRAQGHFISIVFEDIILHHGVYTSSLHLFQHVPCHPILYSFIPACSSTSTQSPSFPHPLSAQALVIIHLISSTRSPPPWSRVQPTLIWLISSASSLAQWSPHFPLPVSCVTSYKWHITVNLSNNTWL